MNFYLKCAIIFSLTVFAVKSEEEPKCASEDSVSYIPSSDCSKFWQCSGGQLISQHCPNGLYFNSELNYCDWPENVDCPNDKNNEDNDENEDTVNNNEANDDKQIDNEDNNEQNEEEQNNNDNENDDTQNNNEQNDDDNEQEEDAQNNNANDNDNSENNNASGLCENVECPAEDGIVVIHTSGPDCTSFCKCSSGVAYLQKCPPGLQFNSVLEVCDFPENANCGQIDNNDKDNNEENNDEENNNEQIDDKQNDNENEDTSSNNTNNNDNNEEIKELELCENVECPVEDPDTVVQRPGPNCTTFCKCSRGTAYLQNCPQGLYYNPTLEVCDYQEQSGCEENNNKTSDDADNEVADDEDDKVSDNEDDKVPDDNDGSVPDDEDNKRTTDRDDKISDNDDDKRPADKDGKVPDGANSVEDVTDENENGTEENGVTCSQPCSEAEDGTYAASNCNNYCLCSNGQQYIMTCPNNLQYNAQGGFCDWPENS